MRRNMDTKCVTCKKEAMRMVRDCGLKMCELSQDLRDDREIVIAAIRNNPEALRFASYRLRSDRDIFLMAIRMDGNAIQYGSEDLRNDASVLKQANCWELFIGHAGTGLRDDIEMMRHSSMNDYQCVRNASRRLRNDYEFVASSLASDESIRYISDELRNNTGIMREYLINNTNALEYASDEMRDDKDIVLEFIKMMPSCLQYASDRLKDDIEVIVEAVTRLPSLLVHASERLRDDYDIVRISVAKDGENIVHASGRLRRDTRIVMLAIESSPKCVAHLPEELRDNEDVVWKAVSMHGNTLRHASSRLRDHKSIVLQAVESYPKAIVFASERLRYDRDVILAAIDHAIAFNFVDEGLRHDREFIQEAISRNADFIEVVSDEVLLDRRFMLSILSTNLFAIQYIRYNQHKNNCGFSLDLLNTLERLKYSSIADIDPDMLAENLADLVQTRYGNGVLDHLLKNHKDKIMREGVLRALYDNEHALERLKENNIQVLSLTELDPDMEHDVEGLKEKYRELYEGFEVMFID